MVRVAPSRSLITLLLIGCCALELIGSPDGVRVRKLELKADGRAGFTLLGPERTGITFSNTLPDSAHLTNQIYLNGSGVAAGDVDGDGLCDLYFARLIGPNQLFLNRGNWKFEDRTPEELQCLDHRSTGAAFADLDGDGDLDLLVNSVGDGTRLFVNSGAGQFSLHPEVLNQGRGGMSLGLADLDGDGDLDIYIANYRTSALMDMPNTHFSVRMVRGKPTIDKVDGRPASAPDLANRFRLTPQGGVEEDGEPDVLYRNDGNLRFTPIGFTSGAFRDENGFPLQTPPFDWGLSVLCRDINEDGLPDIYVCNDFQSPERVWINQGGMRFRLISPLAIRHTSLFSMGVDFADIDRDGFDDFVVLDMLSRDHGHRMNTLGDGNARFNAPGDFASRPQYSLNTLFLNRGDSTYSEIAQFSGVTASDWAWAVAFLDVDLDGWEDLLITNGAERDGRNIDVGRQLREFRTARPNLSRHEILMSRRLFPRFDTPNVAFRNRGNLQFEEVSDDWGFADKGVSHGMALADLDSDGDLDVLVNNMNQLAGVYRNDAPGARLPIRLIGKAPNTAAIGAKITVSGTGPTQSQQIVSGGRYLSADDPLRTFAAAGSNLTVQVRWRNGSMSTISNAVPNHLLVIDENAVEQSRPGGLDQPPMAPVPFFQDVSLLLGHSHTEPFFNDLERQPLCPRLLSQCGPGTAWFDMDGDGADELFIGTGKGGQLAAFKNSGSGTFSRLNGEPWSRTAMGDQTGIVAWRAKDELYFLVGGSSYEDGLEEPPLARYTREPATSHVPSEVPKTIGPMAAADFDADGDIDLFVGGHCLGKRYPEAAAPHLYRNRDGKLELDTENTSRLRDTGLINSAIFTDLNNDGFAELVLGCEWGPIRVFRNDAGRFSEATDAMGLAGFRGWWNGINAGDLNNDGLMDLVAAGWGRNTPYEEFRHRPLRMYYGDLDGDGTVEIIEAHYDKKLANWVPNKRLDLLAKGLPFLSAQFDSNSQFGKATVPDLLGEFMAHAAVSEANSLESAVFINRGDRFEHVPLPFQAQLAPAFAVCIGDLDGDGNEDIFLGQNFFALPPETVRHDGGCGLWLRGDGSGKFHPVSPQESGIAIHGEQRGAALGDFNGDRMLDLVVSQNGSQTKLYRNRAGKPGLRVELLGPPGNPQGIGAAMRLNYPSKLGHTREVRCGSGYWSQDSFTQVLGMAERPTQLSVRWPGGKTTEMTIPPDATVVQVRWDE